MQTAFNFPGEEKLSVGNPTCLGLSGGFFLKIGNPQRNHILTARHYIGSSLYFRDSHMFKQAVILALSVSGIAIAVASVWNSGDAPAEEAVAAPAQPEKKAAPVTKPAEDEDYYSDEDSDFVFGEPVTYLEDGEKPANTKEDSKEYKESTSSSAQSSTYVPPKLSAQPRPNKHKSPAEGEPGSKSNPIDVGRQNPTAPPADAVPVARLD